jgi:hypothetical protein
MSSLPSNVHISQHPCLKAKISQLRSQSTGARDAKRLIHDISTMLGYEALGSALSTTQQGSVRVSIHPKALHPTNHNPGSIPTRLRIPHRLHFALARLSGTYPTLRPLNGRWYVFPSPPPHLQLLLTFLQKPSSPSSQTQSQSST